MSGKGIYLSLITIITVCCLPLSAATPKLQERLGAKHLNVVKNAKYATILAMVPEAAQKQYGSIKEVHLSHEEIERLKRNILDDHNYDFGTKKNCRFNPEISLKFEDANEQIVHLFVSPSCNQMLFGMGSHSVLVDYDPAHVRLEHFFQQLIAETKDRNKATYAWQKR